MGVPALVEAAEQEGADLHVLQGVRILALVDLDVRLLLVLEDGVEDLGARRRQLAVAPDEGHELVRVGHAVELSRRAGAEGVRRDVDQHGLHVLPHLDPRLHPGPERDAQVGVHFAVRFLPQALREDGGDPRDAGGPAHQQHAVELARAHVGVLERPRHRLEGAVDEGCDVVFEIGAAQLVREMPGLPAHRADVVFLDEHPGLGRQLDLGSFGRAPEPRLQETVVAGALDAELRLDVGVEPLEDQRVEVVAAELVVAGGGQDLDHALLDPHHRNVERSAAEVVDEERAAPGGAALVGERGGRRLVDDPDHGQAAISPASRVAWRCASVK